MQNCFHFIKAFNLIFSHFALSGGLVILFDLNLDALCFSFFYVCWKLCYKIK